MRAVEVWIQDDGEDRLAGTLSVWERGGQTFSTFAYDAEFIYGGDGFDIAPRLDIEDGFFQFRGLPLFVEDAGPDRWGAHLLNREASAKGLAPPDRLGCILAASDHARQGALRFRAPGGDQWMRGSAIPARIDIADLLAAADDVADDAESFAPYARLLETGTSALGGARPKASVVLEDGTLMMAKFPMSTDRHNVSVWEKVTLDLARQAGIEVPDSELVTVGGRHVLLMRRFDRIDGVRVPYVSFRTFSTTRTTGNDHPTTCRSPWRWAGSRTPTFKTPSGGRCSRLW